MNKILRLTFAAALALVSTLSFAQTTVTFTAGTDKASARGAATLTKDDVSIAIGKNGGDFSRTDNYRLYSGQNLTISSTVGNITKIAFTCSIESKDKTTGGANNLTTETGTYTPSSDNLTGVWEGTSSSVVFKATPKQFRATKIEVTYTSNGTSLAAPTIAGDETFTESTTVTLTAADGATIYYTTDGQDPDDREGTPYTAPFTINTTTTVKAIAYKGDQQSSIATKTFTKEEPLKLTGAGTLENPYTCADVITLENASKSPADNVYVKGKVSQAATSISNYGDINYYISDDGTTTSQVEAYNSLYFKKAKYTSETQFPKLGDEVVLCGKITKYNSTIELARGNYLVSLKASEVKVDTLTFTTAEALTALKAGTQPAGVCYITGIVSNVDTTGVGKYGNITYKISDDGSEAEQLTVFRGKSFNGESFTNDFFVKIGDKVKILGLLVNHKNNDGNVTPEVSANSKLIELNGKTTGIHNVKADKAVLDVNAPLYNLAGQRVDKSFKGIVIQKGHKFLNK